MAVVREFVDASKPMAVIPLPESLRNQKLEIIIFPTEEKKEISSNEPESLAIEDSLVGCVPDNGMDLPEFRAERLKKYEITD